MDNFILWSISNNQRSKELSFFATSVQIPRINRGTSAMIAEMLEDLGCAGSLFREWEIDHFATNYLMDFPVSECWEDVWQDTCEIKLKLLEPIELALEDTELIHSYAFDESWEGEPFKAPVKCIIVADFYDFESLEKAKKILTMVGRLKEDITIFRELQSCLPKVPQRQLERLREAYLDPNISMDDQSPHISMQQRAGLPYQLIVSLGIFDEKFFLNKAKFAEMVQDIIYELKGTTTWYERTDSECITRRCDRQLKNQPAVFADTADDKSKPE